MNWQGEIFCRNTEEGLEHAQQKQMNVGAPLTGYLEIAVEYLVTLFLNVLEISLMNQFQGSQSDPT